MLGLRLQRMLGREKPEPMSWAEATRSIGNRYVAEVVRQVSAVHEGGRPYFEELDRALDWPDTYRILTDHARALYPEATFVVSGHFGFGYQMWAKRHGHRALLTAPGGLRYDSPDYLFDWTQVLGHHQFVFLDDTLYLGRTMRRVDDGLRRVARRLTATVVAYDGSHELMPRVHSLYRYFDESDIPKSERS